MTRLLKLKNRTVGNWQSLDSARWVWQFGPLGTCPVKGIFRTSQYPGKTRSRHHLVFVNGRPTPYNPGIIFSLKTMLGAGNGTRKLSVLSSWTGVAPPVSHLPSIACHTRQRLPDSHILLVGLVVAPVLKWDGFAGFPPLRSVQGASQFYCPGHFISPFIVHAHLLTEICPFFPLTAHLLRSSRESVHGNRPNFPPFLAAMWHVPYIRLRADFWTWTPIRQARAPRSGASQLGIFSPHNIQSCLTAFCTRCSATLET